MAQGSGRHQRGLALWWTARTWRRARLAVRLAARRSDGVEHDHEKMFAHERCANVALFGPPAAAATRPRSDQPSSKALR
jgi:hypothetical protein